MISETSTGIRRKAYVRLYGQPPDDPIFIKVDGVIYRREKDQELAKLKLFQFELSKRIDSLLSRHGRLFRRYEEVRETREVAIHKRILQGLELRLGHDEAVKVMGEVLGEVDQNSLIASQMTTNGHDEVLTTPAVGKQGHHVNGHIEMAVPFDLLQPQPQSVRDQGAIAALPAEEMTPPQHEDIPVPRQSRWKRDVIGLAVLTGMIAIYLGNHLVLQIVTLNSLAEFLLGALLLVGCLIWLRRVS